MKSSVDKISPGVDLNINAVLVPAYIARDAVRIDVMSDYFGDMLARPLAIDRDLKVALLEIVPPPRAGKLAPLLLKKYWSHKEKMDVTFDLIHGQQIAVFGFARSGFRFWKTMISGSVVVPPTGVGYDGAGGGIGVDRAAPARLVRFGLSPAVDDSSLGGFAFCGREVGGTDGLDVVALEQMVADWKRRRGGGRSSATEVEERGPVHDRGRRQDKRSRSGFSGGAAVGESFVEQSGGRVSSSGFVSAGEISTRRQSAKDAEDFYHEVDRRRMRDEASDPRQQHQSMSDEAEQRLRLKEYSDIMMSSGEAQMNWVDLYHEQRGQRGEKSGAETFSSSADSSRAGARLQRERIGGTTRDRSEWSGAHLRNPFYSFLQKQELSSSELEDAATSSFSYAEEDNDHAAPGRRTPKTAAPRPPSSAAQAMPMVMGMSDVAPTADSADFSFCGYMSPSGKILSPLHNRLIAFLAEQSAIGLPRLRFVYEPLEDPSMRDFLGLEVQGGHRGSHSSSLSEASAPSGEDSSFVEESETRRTSADERREFSDVVAEDAAARPDSYADSLLERNVEDDSPSESSPTAPPPHVEDHHDSGRGGEDHHSAYVRLDTDSAALRALADAREIRAALDEDAPDVLETGWEIGLSRTCPKGGRRRHPPTLSRKIGDLEFGFGVSVALGWPRARSFFFH